MDHAKITAAMLILLLIAGAICAKASDNDAIFALCNKNTYAHGTPNESNLSAVLRSLLGSAALASDGFSTASNGGGPAASYGLLQCRPDVSRPNCRRCALRAMVRVLDMCGGAVGGRVQMEHCFLRYESYDFRRRLDTSVVLVLVNVNKVASADAYAWDGMVKGLLVGLSQRASSAGNRSAFGRGGEAVALFGMATCRRDLSGPDCSACLSKAIDGLSKYSSGRIGAQIFLDGCSLRYETIPFYNPSP